MLEFKRVSGFLTLTHFFLDKCSHGTFGIIFYHVCLSEVRGLIHVCSAKQPGALGSEW